MKIINLDSRFSTTRMTTKQQPYIENNLSSVFPNILFFPSNEKRQGEGGLRTKGYFKKSYNKTFLTSTSNEDNLTYINLFSNNSTELNQNNKPLYLPLVTIISVVLNDDKHLESTIQSVIDQTYNNVEYIVIDGGSKDNTINVIRKYEKTIDYWVSESDLGIYDAMNKGIKAATGDIVGILNSGDLYTNNAVEEVIKLYHNNKQKNDCLIITGGMYRFDKKRNLYYRLLTNQKDLNTRINKAMPISHPATFVTRKVYETLGAYDLNFSLSGDYDFIFRAYHSRIVEFIFTDLPLAHMMMGGVSMKFKSLWIRSIEHFAIRKNKLKWLTNFTLSGYWLIVALFRYFMTNVFSGHLLALYYNIRHARKSL
jgi:glycosyltransferase involved in cell wall biosynthesis